MSSWEADIENAEAEIRRLEDRREKLETELLEATQRAGDSAQLDFIQKEREKSQHDHQENDVRSIEKHDDFIL